MTPEQLDILKIVLLVVGAPAAVLTLREANRLQWEGAKLYPLGWAIAAFVTIGLSTPVFLLFRAKTWVPETVERQKAREAEEQE